MTVLHQTHILDLTDDELLDYLGYCYEEIKNLEERLKNDEEILELEQRLKDLKSAKYGDNIRSFKAQARAARAVAQAKGLKFNLPEKINNES